MRILKDLRKQTCARPSRIASPESRVDRQTAHTQESQVESEGRAFVPVRAEGLSSKVSGRLQSSWWVSPLRLQSHWSRCLPAGRRPASRQAASTVKNAQNAQSLPAISGNMNCPPWRGRPVAIDFKRSRHMGDRRPHLQRSDRGQLELRCELPSRQPHDSFLHSMGFSSHSLNFES